MNTLSKLFCTTTAAVVFSFAFAPLASSAPAAADQPASSTARSLAKMYPYGERARDLLGVGVRSNAGENLGKLNDLLVDAHSGRIVYAVVSTGGVLGVGDTLHAVPFSAVGFASDAHENLQVDTTLADWQRAPVYNPDYIVSLADQEKADYIFRHYHQTWEPLADAPNGSSTATEPRLLSARSVIGRDVRVGDQAIGEAEDLIVNVGSRHAQVLLRADPAFAGTADHFVVPFSKVTANTNRSGTLATTLTRDDFKSVQTFDNHAWDDSSGNSIYRWKIVDPSSAHASSE